ncbi:MAG: ribosome maturation factor RimM [Desulfobacterales bacterium]
MIPVGKIVGSHGLKGALKVHPYAESVSVLEPGERICLKHEGGSPVFYAIQWVKPHRQVFRLSLEGVTSLDHAKALVGTTLLIDERLLPELAEGTFYWSDLIGLSVFTVDDRFLGHVESIIPTAGNDVYVVKDDDQEILIPALESVVQAIDVEKKVMRVALPEGL